MAKYECRGHSKKCRFCKKKGGHARKVMGTDMVEVERTLEGTKTVIDFCCVQCAKNQEYLEKKLKHPRAAAILGGRIPRKGDELPRGTW